MADVEVSAAGEGVALVELNRPEKMNAVRRAMWQAIGETFESLSADRHVRVIVLAGRGGHFSAGADIAEFATVRKDAETGAAYNADIARAIHAIEGAPKPVIAAIAGNCIGGGLELALACDFRIADANARAGITAAKRGLVYGIDACRMLVDVVGKVMAKHILYTGVLVHAEEGHRIGLFDRLADGEPVASALEYADALKAGAPLSVEGAKMAIDALAAGREEAVREAHGRLAARALESEDYREATRAFQEKRPPVFTGR
jgi:enoyl-CoA hydratase/carnithine racemase